MSVKFCSTPRKDYNRYFIIQSIEQTEIQKYVDFLKETSMTILENKS
jgi:hypothetical protein